MKQLPIVIFCLSISYITHSQKSGKVIDAETKKPLEYASISLKNSPHGTVTNSDGNFDFFIPPGLESDTVIISFLGYVPHRVVASSLASVIKLAPKALKLDEVVVRSNVPTAMEIITKAFDNVEANYPTGPYVYSGFVRESWMENKKTVSLVESAVDIYDDGYHKRKDKSVRVREKVHLKFARASDNNMNEPFKPYLNKYNALTSVLRWNQVKYPNPEVIGNLKTKEVILEDVVVSNNRVLYVVSFISHSNQNDLFERKDKYYIDAETYAIKRIEWREYSRNGKYRTQPWSVDAQHSYQSRDVVTTYEFEEYKGKMYLRYFSEHGESDIYNTNTKSVDYELAGDMMFVVTDIHESDSRAPKNTMDHGKSLSLQTTPYNESFWSDYEQVKVVPLTEKQVRDLESKESLATQFARSGQQSKKAKSKSQ